MKKGMKLVLILAVLSLLLLGISACQGGGQDTVSQQQAKVERGDIEISIKGSGQVEATREARLTFGSAGEVDKILVKEGDEVKEGDVLAKLDTSALELARAQSQLALTQSNVGLTQAQLAFQTAEYNLKKTRDTQGTLELALLNAQVNLDLAQRSLDTGIVAADYKAAKAQLDKAKAWYKYVVEDWPRESVNTDEWHLALKRAEDQLKAAQTLYDNVLSGYDSQEIAIKKKQVEAAEFAVTQAQKNIDDLAEDIAIQEMQVVSANQSITQAEQSVELSKQSLDEAQRQLDEATIIAPFDGVVAMVMVKEGDNIPSPAMAPTTIVHLIAPGYMELVVEVDEIDIPLLNLNQEAKVTVDALPGSEFKGTVTAVYPTPKEEGGVVLYDVRLALDVPKDSRIKIGMSASAEVMVEKHTDVLIIPSRAIKEDNQGNTVVDVMLADGKIEERKVVVGLDDGFRSEIVSGLQEGETVTFEVRLKTPSTSMF